MNRRQFTKRAALTLTVAGLGGSAFKCGISKEKAVRVTGFVIEIAKESVPLLNLLNARDLAITVDAKVIPALEKLKSALADVDIPGSQSTLATVRSTLSAVGNGLLNLPDSPRRTTIIGILASINVLLLTVEAFVESETVPPATGTITASDERSGKSAKMLK